MGKPSSGLRLPGRALCGTSDRHRCGKVILGVKHGYTMPELEKIMTKSLEPTGLILLVTACGGVLRYMLQYSGLGDIIGQAVSSANLPIVVVAFVVAALVRICVGSATVAMTMAAGIIAAMPEIAGLSPLYLACTTAAIAGGATVCSHFNDSGFWLVKSLVGMDEKTTLKTWTIMETLVGGTGFLVALDHFILCINSSVFLRLEKERQL